MGGRTSLRSKSYLIMRREKAGQVALPFLCIFLTVIVDIGEYVGFKNSR
jgi:hypothetical protein